MRILFVNDGIADAGGVQTYLDAVMHGLAARGHELGFLHCERSGQKSSSPDQSVIRYFSVEDKGLDRTFADLKLWSPDVCFSHNMHRLDVERRLLEELPVVKFMHGYFGTCIGGQKSFFFPQPEPCHRRFGRTCLLLYLPRRCGQISPLKMVKGYEWAKQQNKLFHDYRAIIVASEHMKREYVQNGADEKKVIVNPLFSACLSSSGETSWQARTENHLLFLGRMTKLKGGDLLIRAVEEASRRLGTNIRLTMAGDGPQRAPWERLARQLNVKVVFTGWVTGEDYEELLRAASVLVVPSVWPEPFGLVGLEAAGYGIPSVAFDVGGIRDWLIDGVNGYVVPGRVPSSKALANVLVEILGQPELLEPMRTKTRELARELSLAKHLDRLELTLSGAFTRAA